MFTKSSTVFIVVGFIYCKGIFVQRTNGISDNVNQWLATVDEELHEFNRLSADLAWRLMTDEANETVLETAAVLGAAKSTWKNTVCEVGLSMDLETVQQRRMYSLLCRGPKYSQYQARELSRIMDNLSGSFTAAAVCVPEHSWPTAGVQVPSIDGRVCLQGEPDLEQLISRQDLTADQLHWVWKSWHDAVGPRVKADYPDLVKILNQAAGNNGYGDIGQVWREELEIPNLKTVLKNLYEDIEPLYVMLHAVIRHELVQKYGPRIVDPVGPIPAHLLGNMWAQDWSALVSLLIPADQQLHLDDHIGHKNWTVKDMVAVAEDMYVSLGLPAMTEKFWKFSKFERDDKNSSLCHGTAANMFAEDDYRILLCAKLSMEDFYVIHHEMGHIEYYMAYSDQPAVYQDGANSAFQESIGDAIMTAVMAPQHLHRLGLLSDRQLVNENLDAALLLRQALAKIPQIPYAMLIDEYRWDIFSGKIQPDAYNDAFWTLNRRLRGIVPRESRDERYFDAGAKFHVPDNTPYIRYFFSAILQIEMFKGLCELTLYGKISNSSKDIPFPLHKCDIYGSRKAGNQLKKMMELGASQIWQKSLKVLTGKAYITAKPLLEYYKPVYKWLQNRIAENNIPVGW